MESGEVNSPYNKALAGSYRYKEKGTLYRAPTRISGIIDGPTPRGGGR